MKGITNISVYNDSDLKSIKNKWLYDIETKKKIMIKYIIFYEGTGEVKVSLYDHIEVEMIKEILFANKNDFYSFLSKYSRIFF
jgi:hypothetical protein